MLNIDIRIIINAGRLALRLQIGFPNKFFLEISF
jgi:hypothetical protein